MSMADREEAAHIILRSRQPGSPPDPFTNARIVELIRVARGNMDHSRMGMGGPTEWLDHLSATIDATKEVLVYLKAQAAMDMFAHNPDAKRLYTNIINAGMDRIFRGNNDL